MTRLGKKTLQEKFWYWFQQNEQMLFDFERDQDRTFDLLQSALNLVKKGLTFEFGPKTDENQREFVISANGMKDRFPAVITLKNAAPSMPRWQITAFRPRRDFEAEIELGGIRVNQKDLQFSLLSNGITTGIYVYVPGAGSEDSNYTAIAYLMLDHVLGEFDVETGLGLIQVLPPESQNNFKRHPFNDLPKMFDALAIRREGRSGKPS